MTRPAENALPCPFCGDAAPTIGSLGEEFFFVECGGCTAMGPVMPDAETAVKHWNHRATKVAKEHVTP